MLKIILLTFIVGSHGVSAQADSRGIDWDIEIGFNGYFQLHTWTPVNVTLDNRGQETKGKLEVIVTSGSEYRGDVYRTIYASEVYLPQGSRKRYAFTVLIRSFTHDLILRLRQDNHLLFTRSISLRSQFTEKDFAIVADNFAMPDILSVLPKHLYPANVRPQFLPESWYGYDSVKLLILRSDTIGQLRNRQFQALIQWLRQGGSMVLGTGLNYGSLNEERMQRILPIIVEGHRQINKIQSLRQFCSRELIAYEPFLVLSTRIEGSRVLVKENDIPIIVRKRTGFGQVVFLAFDFNSPPFSQWDGRSRFWEKLLSLQPEPSRPLIELEDRRIANTMFAGMPLGFANFKAVVGFVTAYLIFLWLCLKRIKRPGKSRWRYGLSVLLLITLFSIIASRGLYHTSANQTFAHNSFCQIDLADPSAPASAKYFIGLYSLTSLAYQLSFGSNVYPVTHIMPGRSDIKIPAPYALHKSDNGQQIIGTIGRWSHVMFKLKLHVASPLTGYARRDGSFLTLEIDSELPHDLINCLIYYNKRFSPVANIGAGSRQIIKVDLVKLKKKEIFDDHQADRLVREFYGNGSNDYLRTVQQHLATDILLGINEKFKSRPDSIILIGWMNSGLIMPEFVQSGPPVGTGITTINWELPVEITL